MPSPAPTRCPVRCRSPAVARGRRRPALLRRHHAQRPAATAAPRRLGRRPPVAAAQACGLGDRRGRHHARRPAVGRRIAAPSPPPSPSSSASTSCARPNIRRCCWPTPRCAGCRSTAPRRAGAACPTRRPPSRAPTSATWWSPSSRIPTRTGRRHIAVIRPGTAGRSRLAARGPRRHAGRRHQRARHAAPARLQPPSRRVARPDPLLRARHRLVELATLCPQRHSPAQKCAASVTNTPPPRPTGVYGRGRALWGAQLGSVAVSDIGSQVREILSFHLGIDGSQLGDDTRFEDLGADSLDVVEIVMSCEERFGVEIPNREATRARHGGRRHAVRRGPDRGSAPGGRRAGGRKVRGPEARGPKGHRKPGASPARGPHGEVTEPARIVRQPGFDRGGGRSSPPCCCCCCCC